MCAFLGLVEAESKDGTIYFCGTHIEQVAKLYSSYKYIETSVPIWVHLTQDQIEEVILLRETLQGLLQTKKASGHEHFVQKLKTFLAASRAPCEWSGDDFQLDLLDPW